MNYRLIFLFLIIIKLSRSTKYLLPTALIPLTYDIKILSTLYKGQPNDFTFQGDVNIQLLCNKTTKEITLHAYKLQIINESISVTNIKSEKTIKVLKFDLDPKHDFVTFHLETPLEESEKYNVHISYNGIINKDLAGFYGSSYKCNNETTWLALTHFEPTYARYAFPCFDEPAYKAKFKISLGHDKNLNSISNMPLEKTESLNESYVLDIYQETVPMSTYLVAFIISDFEFITSPSGVSKTEFKIWSRKKALPHAKFASTTGPRALTFFENYFDIPFPLPKQDMAAIPDFSSGAMENWGLITYRETSLLYDPELSTTADKKTVAYTICHELAHQWFGNLVTMKWWNDLWLNEGFATYMGTICVENLFPELEYETEKFVNFMDTVYHKDSLNSSVPLSNEVEKPDKIRENFETIAYKKGALIIRMIQKSFGENVLRTGITAYLKENSYKNAQQDDLWNALTEAAHKYNAIPNEMSIKQIMDSWTLQTGYPIVNVERNYETGAVTFSQKRYIQNTNSIANDSLNKKECWWIPLSFTSADQLDFNNTKPSLWLTCPENNATLTYDNAEGWIIFNLQRSGIYIVNYDERNWDLLANHLRTKDLNDITEINRYALIDNIMYLADLGDVPYSRALGFLEYLKNEKEYRPWYIALYRLNKMYERLHNSEANDIMKSYIQAILKPQYKKLGGFTNTKNTNKSELQILLTYAACLFDVQECLQDALNILHAYIRNPRENKIEDEVLATVYCNGLKTINKEDWNLFWDQYLKSTIDAKLNNIITVLSCTNQKQILQMYLNFTIDENSSIRKQDLVSVFSAVAGNKDGYEIAQSFFYNHGPELLEILLPHGLRFGTLVNEIARPMNTVEDYEKLKNYLDKYPQFAEHANLGINQALETIQSNIRWFTKYNAELTNVLSTEQKVWASFEQGSV